MDKILFDFGFIQIRWYSFIILIAALTASFLIIKEAKKKAIPEDKIVDILFYGIIIGIIGARIHYVLFNLSYYSNNLLEIFQVWKGGLAIHGGIIATLIFIIIYGKKNKINTMLLLDILATYLLLAQAIGRWGNFFNQEAYGRTVSLEYLKSLHLPTFIINGMKINNVYKEPTFLYESLLSLIGFVILLLIRKFKKIKTGQLFSIYLVWYGIERFIVEIFRSDSLMLGPIKVAKLISIFFCIIGIYLFFNNKNKLYNDDKLL